MSRYICRDDNQDIVSTKNLANIKVNPEGYKEIHISFNYYATDRVRTIYWYFQTIEERDRCFRLIKSKLGVLSV